MAYNYVPRLLSLFTLSHYLLSLAPNLTLILAQTTLDPNSVSITLRAQWCQGQTNTCRTLCSGNANTNTCTVDTLSFSCTCASNNSAPGLAFYKYTMPTFICEQIFANCISAAPGDAVAQAKCSATEKANCGQLDPNTFVAGAVTTTSASSSSTTSTTRSSTSSSQQSSSSSLTSSSSSSSSSSSTSTNSTQSSSSPSSSSYSSSSSSSSSSPSSSSTHPSTPTPTLNPPSPGLSTGAKAGIAVGTILSVLLLLGGGFLIGRRQRNPKPMGHDMPEMSAHSIHEVPQLETRERAGELEGRRLPDNRKYELP